MTNIRTLAAKSIALKATIQEEAKSTLLACLHRSLLTDEQIMTRMQSSCSDVLSFMVHTLRFKVLLIPPVCRLHLLGRIPDNLFSL